MIWLNGFLKLFFILISIINSALAFKDRDIFNKINMILAIGVMKNNSLIIFTHTQQMYLLTRQTDDEFWQNIWQIPSDQPFDISNKMPNLLRYLTIDNDIVNETCIQVLNGTDKLLMLKTRVPMPRYVTSRQIQLNLNDTNVEPVLKPANSSLNYLEIIDLINFDKIIIDINGLQDNSILVSTNNDNHLHTIIVSQSEAILEKFTINFVDKSLVNTNIKNIFYNCNGQIKLKQCDNNQTSNFPEIKNPFIHDNHLIWFNSDGDVFTFNLNGGSLYNISRNDYITKSSVFVNFYPIIIVIFLLIIIIQLVIIFQSCASDEDDPVKNEPINDKNIQLSS